MLTATRGIVLKYVKYRESSVIVTIYTEEYGIQSYIVNGIRSVRAKRGMGYFQPLMLLDLVVYHHNQREIHRLSEWKMSSNLFSLYSDMHKSSISLFISELLYKSLKEVEPNEDTFRFIFHSIEILDNLTEGVHYFHIQFMVKLARYLGFATDHYISETDEKIEKDLKFINTSSYGSNLNIEWAERKKILDYLIGFYSIHISGFGKLKSYQILSEIFSK
ncbi:MAG: DNA repair protein RecO [Cyclobacteriaceae bacterium]|nr:DNA repair protein RecO [Cyclobacteriaceae bacterium]